MGGFRTLIIRGYLHVREEFRVQNLVFMLYSHKGQQFVFPDYICSGHHSLSMYSTLGWESPTGETREGWEP